MQKKCFNVFMIVWNVKIWFCFENCSAVLSKTNIFHFSASKNVRSFCGDAVLFIRKACINLVLLHVLLSVIIQKARSFSNNPQKQQELFALQRIVGCCCVYRSQSYESYDFSI